MYTEYTQYITGQVRSKCIMEGWKLDREPGFENSLVFPVEKK